MKKILSLFVCLALLGAGTAFTLDLPDALKIPGLTVTGDVRTGLRVEGGTYDDLNDGSGNNGFGDGAATGAVDPKVYGYSDDLDDGKPFRAQLQLVWERDNLGVKTRFRYNPSSGGELSSKLSDLNNTVQKAFVYGWLLDKKIKVSAGKGTDGAWGLFYSNYATTGDFDGKDGIKFEVSPIKGLNLGVHYGSDNLFNKAVNHTDTSFSDQAETYRRFVVGAKYTADSFGVVASTVHNFYDRDGDNDGITNGDYDPKFTESSGEPYEPAQYVDKPLPNTSNILFGFWVAPIKPLRIDLSVAAVNLGSKTVKDLAGGDDIPGAFGKGDYAKYWYILPKLKAEYAINDSLSAGLCLTDMLIADEYYFKEAGNDNSEDDGLGLFFPITINPYAAYAINDDITVSLDLNFKINVGGSDQFGFGLKPGAEFSLGSGAKFVVYDELTLYTKSKEIYEKNGSLTDDGKKHPNAYNAGPLKGASGTENILQFDFVWTF